MAPDETEATRELATLATRAGARLSALSDAMDELRMTREAIEGLAESLSHLASSEDIERVERERRRRRTFDYIFVALIVVIMGAVLVRLQQTADINRENGKALVECTTASEPGDVHECWEEGVRRQGEAIQQISDAAAADHQTLIDEIAKLREDLAARP